MPSAETARLVAELTLKDKMSAGLRTADRNLRSFDKSTSNTQKSLSKFGNNIGKGIAIGAGAAAVGIGLVVHAASDFEDAFAGVRKTVNATPAELDKLATGFRDMAKEIPISAADLARLGEAAGALGIEGTDNIKEFVRVTALLGETTNLTADDAATSLGVLSNVLHLTSDEYSKFASSLVALGNAGASTESDIIQIAQRAGAAGEQIGLTTEEVLGFSSAIASLGLEAEAGGTAFQNFLIISQKAVSEGGKDLKTLAKTAGVSTKAFKKAFEQDAGKALQTFLAGLGKLSAGDQLQILDQLGLSGARLSQTILGLANNSELVGTQLTVANDAFKENTALTKEAAERNKTFASQMQITKNVLTDIGITIGSKLLPKLVPLLQTFNKFVSDNQGKIEKFGDDLAKAFTNVADAVGKTDWTPFITGLQLSAQLAKGAFDAFRSLPKEFQALILVGAGVNKVTGGLITGIGKDIAKGIGGGLFDKFLARGSSPANPLWVQSVGGVGAGGTPTPAGGGGTGKLGKVLDAASKILIVGIVAETAKELHDGLVGTLEDRLASDTLLPTDNLSWPWGPRNTPTILPEIFGGNGALGGTSDGGSSDKLNDTFKIVSGEQAARQNVTNERLESIRNQNSTAAAAAIRDSASEVAAVNAAKVAVDAAAARQITQLAGDSASERATIAAASIAQRAEQAQTTHAAQQAAAAIRDKDLSVKLTNTNNLVIQNRFSARESSKSQTTFKQTSRWVAS